MADLQFGQFDEAEIQALMQGESLSREDAVEILKIAAHMEAEKDAAAAKPKAKAKGKAKSKDLEPSGQSSTKRKAAAVDKPAAKTKAKAKTKAAPAAATPPAQAAAPPSQAATVPPAEEVTDAQPREPDLLADTVPATPPQPVLETQPDNESQHDSLWPLSFSNFLGLAAYRRL